MENITNEEWRSISGYEGYYEISNMGRVRSLDRISYGRSLTGRLLRPGRTSGGHRSVGLSRDGVATQYYVHQLVAAAYIGPRPVGYDICHNDNDPDNNRVQNLRYDTRAGNFADKIANGTANPTGYRNLKPDEVRLIRAGLAAGKKCNRLARDYGLTPASVSNIKTGRTWSNLV